MSYKNKQNSVSKNKKSKQIQQILIPSSPQRASNLLYPHTITTRHEFDFPKCFRHDICPHKFRFDMSEGDVPFFNMFSQKVVSDVDVLGAVMMFGGFCEVNRAHAVGEDCC